MSSDRIQLELKDRLNYTYILTKSLFAIEIAVNEKDYDADKVEGLIMLFYYKIPETWKDKQFIDDINASKESKIVDVRPRFGKIPLDKELCKEYGLKIKEKVEYINYLKIVQAIINLMDRLNMLVRKDKIEKSTGKNLDYEKDETDLDSLIDEDKDGDE